MPAFPPGRRLTHLGADSLVLVWCLAWATVGVLLRNLVASLAEPVRALSRAGTSYDTTMRDVGGRLAQAPVVGDTLRDGFASLAGPGGDVAGAGERLSTLIERLGLGLGLVVALLPIAGAAVPWGLWRAAAARRAAATRRLADRGDLDLLALRALTRQPLRRLEALADDPAGAWRRGDTVVVRALAGLELRDAGLAPPPGGGGRPGDDGLSGLRGEQPGV